MPECSCQGHFSPKNKAFWALRRRISTCGILQKYSRFAPYFCGEGEIRTLDTLRYAGFRNQCFRPLSHLSFAPPKGGARPANRRAQKRSGSGQNSILSIEPKIG